MKKQALFLAFLFCCISTTTKRVVIPVNRSEFHLPVVVHKTDQKWIDYLHPDYLSEFKSVYIGKFKWMDTLDLAAALFEHKSMTEEEYLDQYAEESNGGDLETDGLQLFPDYRSSVAYTTELNANEANNGAFLYYPLYVVNETAHTKFYTYDNYKGWPIQEADDNSNDNRMHWRPMESTRQLSCINSTLTIRIQPGEFLLFLLPKYYGNTTAALRVRMKNGPNILVSNAFLGYLRPRQLIIKKGSWQDLYLQSGDLMAFEDLFYGAVPKGYETLY